MVFYYNLFDGDSKKKEIVGRLNESYIIGIQKTEFNGYQ